MIRSFEKFAPIAALAFASVALVHCGTESPFQDDNTMPSEAAVTSCSVNGGDVELSEIPNESHSSEELATCSSKSECGSKTKVAYDDDGAVTTRGAGETTSKAPTDLKDADGWIFKWRGEASGWSVIGNGWASASSDLALSKLESDCKTNESSDPNNEKRCVLLQMQRKTGGCWPYRTYTTKVKCMCNLNVNAVHPDE